MVTKTFVTYILGLLAASFALTASAELQSIGVAGDGEFTRITLTSDHELEADISLLRSPEGRIISLEVDNLMLAEAPYFGDPVGGVSAYVLDGETIAFELDRPMMVSRRLNLPPSGSEYRHRLILDLSRVSDARFESAANDTQIRRFEATYEPPADPISELAVAASPTLKPWGLGEAIKSIAAQQRFKIAIDPGHGGRDPGAPSVLGGHEKTIVLDTSLELKRLLEADPRYEILLTRETDVYVEHEDRVAKARDWGADLFISVHADAALKPEIYGASVYTISTRGEKRIEGTATKYGWEIPIEDGTSEQVSGILEDLVLRETKSNSAVFAEILVPELSKAGPLVRNSHRQGNLFVLLAPDVPAVLVEIGFLTNRKDARRLKSKRGRQQSAAAIKRAIDAYFEDQALKTAVN